MFNEEGNAIVSNLDRVNAKIKETRKNSLDDLKSSYKTALSGIEEQYTPDSFLEKAFGTDVSSGEISKWLGKHGWGNAITIQPSILAMANNVGKNNTTEEAYKYYKNLQKTSELTEKQQKEYSSIKDKLKDFNTQIENIYSTTKNIDDLEGLKYFDFETGKIVDAENHFRNMSESTKELGKDFKDASNNVKDLATQIDELTKSFDDLSSQIDIIQKAIDELETYGGLTDSTYSSLLKNSPEAVKALMKQGDAIENLKALQKGLRDEQEKTKEEAIHKILSGTEGTSNVDNSKIEIGRAHV